MATATRRRKATPAQQQASKDRVAELHAGFEAKVDSLRSSEDWLGYLAHAAKFHRYSFRNQILIWIQRTDATQVAGYRVWESLGRQVRKGEKGISILAPCIAKRENKKTGKEEKALVGFRAVAVFDVSQTDGDALPADPTALLTGEGSEALSVLYSALADLVAAEGYTLERGDCQGRNGYTEPTNKLVRVRDDVSDIQATKTLAHELTHVLLHANDIATYQITQDRCEVEAESVAYLVLASHGVETDGYSIGYVAGWSSADPKLVRETAQRVQKTAAQIIERLGTE